MHHETRALGRAAPTRLVAYGALVALAALVGAASGACSKGNGGGGGSESTPDAGGEGPGPSTWDLPSDDYLRYAYDVAPPAVFTVYDVIQKDRVDGAITAEDALEQELCHYYGDPCLREEYAQRTGLLPLACATGLDQRLLAEYAALDDAAKGRVLAAWASITGASTSAESLVGDTIVNESSLFGEKEFDLENGTCFVVPRLHPHIKELRNVDTMREIDVPGAPYKLQIFYDSTTDGEEASQIADGFVKQTFVRDMNQKISSTWPKAFDAGIRSSVLKDPQNPSQYKVCNPGGAYRMFVVSSNDSSVTISKSSGPLAGTSSISFNANQVRLNYLRAFVRARGETLPNGQNFANGLVIHEWAHALQYAANAKDPCQEAMADALSQAFGPDSGEPYMLLPGHLYDPGLTLCNGASLAKRYGSSLAFMYLNEKYGITALKDYFDLTANGTWYYDALARVTAAGGGVAKVFHGFAESSLNLDYPPITRFLSAHFPQYRDYYLANGALAASPMDLTDGKVTVRFYSIHGLGIQYLAFNMSPDTLNNEFNIDVKKWDGAFSVFGIKADADDATRYKVTYHGGPYEKGTGTKVEAKFAAPDTEPDILLLVFSNGGDPERDGWGNIRNGEVEIESRPFSASFPIDLSYHVDSTADPNADPNHTYKLSLEMLATMSSEWKGEWIVPPGGDDVSLPGTSGDITMHVPKMFPFAETTEACEGGGSATRSEAPPVLVGRHEEVQTTSCDRLDGTTGTARTTWKSELNLDLGAIDPAAREWFQFIDYDPDHPGMGKAATGTCFQSTDVLERLAQTLENVPATCTADPGGCCVGAPDPAACAAALSQCPTSGPAVVDFYGLWRFLHVPDWFNFAPGTRLQGMVSDPDDPSRTWVVDIGPLSEAMEAWRTYPPRRILYIPDAPDPKLLGQFLPKVIDLGGKDLTQ